MSSTMSLAETFVPGGIVEVFGIVANVFVVEQTFDGRGPEQRSRRHVGRTLANHLDDVLGILRRRCESSVLEVVDSRRQSPANLFGPV